MIKVVHVYKTFYPETVGGVEKNIYDICKATEKYGISHNVLCTSQRTKIETSVFKGISVIRYPQTIHMSSCPVSIDLLARFNSEVQHADIIHYHYPWPFASLAACFTARKKCVATYHSDIVRQTFLRKVLYPLDQYFLHKIDKIIATSPQYAQLSANLRKFSKKVSVIPITISKASYPLPDEAVCNKIKQQFGQFYLFIGQLRYYKGLEAVIEAVKGASFKLVVIGDGPKRKELQRLCDKHSITNVIFLGNLSEQEKVNYLHACYSLVLPSNSRAEAFGISLLEGAMFGKPLISCNIRTGVEYINIHGQTGLVVPPTVAGLHDAMTTLSQQPKLAAAMGKRALQRFQEHFNYEAAGEKLAGLYNELLLEKTLI
jgi:glycosyltransferase involved in cell wall biosynthesis